MILNPTAYRQLLTDDLVWLRTMPNTLERRHIEAVLENEIRHASERIAEARKETPTEGAGQ